jgi:sugar lactone lactonase YvrE
MKKIHFITAIYFLTIGILPVNAQIITTIAGNGKLAHSGDGGLAINAEIADPTGACVDNFGNIYFAEADTNGNSYIRKINSSGIITTVAGGGTSGLGDGGPATLAQLIIVYNVNVDHNGNIYIPDYGFNRIRKVNSSGMITTIAGTGAIGYNGDGIPATAAQLHGPLGITIDNNKNIYICDGYNWRIRKIDTSGIISTIAGTGVAGYTGDNGPATLAQINTPLDIAVDSSGNVYIADGNNVVRKINPAGIITTFAGTGAVGFNGDGGPAIYAEFNSVSNVAVDDSGNVYIGDSGPNDRVRKVNKAGIITTIAGNGIYGFSGDGGPATDAELYGPDGVAIDKNGNVYIADAANNRIRAIVSALSAGTVDNKTAGLEIFPNPTNSTFTLKIPASGAGVAKIVVTNTKGEKIYQTTVETNKPVDITLNGPPGVYFISAFIGSQGAGKEIIKYKY